MEKTLERPLDCKEINKSILKEISLVCSLEGLMLKLKSNGHLMWRAVSLEKTLMLGKTEDEMVFDGITNSMDMGLGGLQVLVMNREAWRA